MLAIPELAMPRTHKVTTVCNGRREVWTDYKEAKVYFLELMMKTENGIIFSDGKSRNRKFFFYDLLALIRD